MCDDDVQFSAVGAAGAPEDLRLWLGEERLLQLVIGQAAQVASTAVRGGDFQHRTGSFPVAQLLAFAAYCYVTGRFDSVEIEERLESDEALRYLCAGRIPCSTVLRHFRRSRRDLLLEMLTSVLFVALSERLRQPWLVAASLKSGHAGLASNDDVAVRAFCREEAARRVSKSVRADAIALDV